MSSEIYRLGGQTEVGLFAQAKVNDAGQRYAVSKNVAFINGGDTEEVQNRLCEPCPGPSYCGAIVSRLSEHYKGGIIPQRDIPTLQGNGIEVSNYGYTVCPRRLIQSAARNVSGGAYITHENDPLNNASAGNQAVEVIRSATDHVLERLRNGIRT